MGKFVQGKPPTDTRHLSGLDSTCVESELVKTTKEMLNELAGRNIVLLSLDSWSPIIKLINRGS